MTLPSQHNENMILSSNEEMTLSSQHNEMMILSPNKEMMLLSHHNEEMTLTLNEENTLSSNVEMIHHLSSLKVSFKDVWLSDTTYHTLYIFLIYFVENTA